MDPIPEISAPQNDVWVQTDDVFVPLEASDGPSARWYAAMAYHPDAGGIVVFGGESLAGAEADTWVLEGATWRRLDIPGPPARARHHMVYDSARRRILMTGGQDASGADLTDTWTFDGTSWTNASAPIAVPPGGLAYDAARDRVVAFGGLERNSRDRLSEFDGATWTASTGMPGARWGFAMAYDARAGEVVVHDGTFRPIGPGFDELWGYDGTSWRERDLEDRPSNRRSAPFAYDARLRRSVLFGGDLVAGMIDLHDLWAYDLSGFRPIDAMTPGPDTGTASGLVFDSVRGVYVAAVVAAGEFQTWELDGRRWLRKETSRAPSATSGFFGMAFDARRGVTVLFGGRAGPPVGETWEYDGGDWTPVMGPGPSARSTVGFTFDAERGVCVLYGGTSGRPPDVIEFADTREFDGTWREVTPVDGVGPGGRFGDNLVFHASRRTVFLHAGEPGALNDTWEFDGVQWSRVRHPVNPGPRARPSVAFDQSRDALILTHGDPADDTWELRYVSDTPDELCRGDVDEDEDGLVDCADPDCDGRACGPRGELCGSGACACPFANETHCGDGHDDDCDGLRDCDDPDCAGATWCMAEANCGDGLDDDRDGQADCGDPGCDGVGFCERRETQCGDGEDNDGDGAADCEDGDCFLVSCAVLE